MHRIIIQISEAAQRAAILAGGNAAREQTFTIGTGSEDGGARARLLGLPAKWTSISKEGSALVLVPSAAKVSPKHFAGERWRNEDWGAFGSSYLDETINLRADIPPTNAEEAIAYAESVASLAWLDEARAARAEQLAQDRAEAEAREEAERPAREAREREREERERAEREERERKAAEEAERRKEIGALFGEPGHPERQRFDAGAMSADEIDNAIETRLTAWLPEPDPETGAFAPLSVEAHRYQVATLRPDQGRTVRKLATGQEAFSFFRILEARAQAWAAKAPERRSVQLWRAVCDCGQALADVVIRDGALEWDGWVALGEAPNGHPEVAED